jgi:hypothetical protein
MTETVQMPLGDYFKGQIEADGYGLGLMIRANYQGHKWISHGGGIDGFTSAMSWLPNDKAGVVVLTNSESRLGGVIENTVIDELIGLKNKTDWVASQKEKEVLAKKTLEEKTASFWAKQVKATQPSHPLSAYTGVYENRGYGRVEVSEKDGQLMLSFDEFSTPLVHYHYDFFTVPKEEKEGLFSQFLTGNVVGFKTNEQGHIFLVSLPLEPSLPSPIEFTRVKVQD